MFVGSPRPRPQILRQSLEQGLIGYWPLDEGAGLVGYDRSGSGNHATYKSDRPVPVRSLTDAGFSTDFSGSDSKSVDVGSLPQFATNTGLTFCAWVKPIAFTNAYESIISKFEGNPYTLLVKSNGKLAVYIRASAVQSYDGSGAYTLQIGVWQFLCATYNAIAGGVGYVNAQVDATFAANGALFDPYSGDNYTIGVHPSIGGREWNGSIREVRAYNRALSAREIQSLYASYFVSPRTIAMTRRRLARGMTSAGVVQPRRTWVST